MMLTMNHQENDPECDFVIMFKMMIPLLKLIVVFEGEPFAGAFGEKETYVSTDGCPQSVIPQPMDVVPFSFFQGILGRSSYATACPGAIIYVFCI